MKQVIAILLLLASVPGQADEVSDGDRFELWNDCLPVGLFIVPLNEETKAFGLTEDRIRTLVESRLRAARLYADNNLFFVYLSGRVGIAGGAHSVDVWVIRSVKTFFKGMTGEAATWERGRLGAHGGNAGFILGNYIHATPTAKSAQKLEWAF